MADERLVKPQPISGFPEWLPEVRAVEQQWLDRIRTAFERYGFCNIETPSVESLDVLAAKGETSQEVYLLRRLQADSDTTDSRLALHFDLTVPFARYVAQHLDDLVFPFKRYQLQRVWRGERPQEGRYREFTQCDIDVVNLDQVPLTFDAEMPRIVHEVFASLGLPPWTINLNNRKVLQGFYEGLQIADPIAVMRAVDKLDKIGPDGVREVLLGSAGLTGAQADSCLELSTIKGTDRGVIGRVEDLGVKSDLLAEGLAELEFVLTELADLPAGSVIADLSIARGLDYYTGTVYECKFTDWPAFGSICSGGRYDNLVSSYVRQVLPGVGLSIGLTRIFAKLYAEGLITPGPLSPTQVLVVVPSPERSAAARETAAGLRRRGINTEMYHQPDKLGRQLRYASRKAIPYVWFPPFEDGRPHEVKDMISGDQSPADPRTWQPPLPKAP